MEERESGKGERAEKLGSEEHQSPKGGADTPPGDGMIGGLQSKVYLHTTKHEGYYEADAAPPPPALPP